MVGLVADKRADDGELVHHLRKARHVLDNLEAWQVRADRRDMPEHREAEAEAVVGAGRVGVADQVLDLGAKLVRQHVFHRLAGEDAGVAVLALVEQHRLETAAQRETNMRIVDLSRDLYHRAPSYPGQPPIIFDMTVSGRRVKAVAEANLTPRPDIQSDAHPGIVANSHA